MSIGSYIIANDLIGVLIKEFENTVVIRDKEGKKHEVDTSCCHEITNPHALSLLMYNKVLTRRAYSS